MLHRQTALLLCGGALWLAGEGAYAATVTSCTESALKQAITDASAGDTITFGCSGVISLTSQVEIRKNLTLDGTGQNVSLSGANKTRVLHISVNSDTTATIKSLTIADGQANDHGGGIYMWNGTTIIDNCQFSRNAAMNYGGAIYNAGILKIVNSTFSQNSAKQGGAVYGANSITNSNFIGNAALEDGGAIWSTTGNPTIENNTFSKNAANGKGGAIYTSYYPFTILKNTFVENSAKYGGAIYGYNYGSYSLSIANNTFSKNMAMADGAALYFDSNSNKISVFNNTLTLNNATQSGGGIFVKNSSVELRNNIIYGNVAAANPDISGTVVSGGNNIVGNISGTTGITNGSNNDMVGKDPLLVALADNGGATKTHALQPTSPAIDKGSDLACNTYLVRGYDQRGITRPQGESCDIGSYEYTATTTTGTNTSTTPTTTTGTNTSTTPTTTTGTNTSTTPTTTTGTNTSTTPTTTTGTNTSTTPTTTTGTNTGTTPTSTGETTVAEGTMADLTFLGLKPTYSIGEIMKVQLKTTLNVANRFRRVDLWVAVQLPNGTLFFMTPSMFDPFSLTPQLFKSSLERTDYTWDVLQFEIPPGMGGDYTFYALYIQETKNPLTDGFIAFRSNLASASTLLQNR